MPLVTYKALCIDANDVSAVQDFWASTLGYELIELDDGDAHLLGTEPGEEVWINRVPEPRTVKQRVHLDVRAESLEPFTSRFKQLSKTGEFSWTTFADPEGGEFCVFTYDEPPAKKFKSLVIDSADHVAISDWWAAVIGGTVSHDDGYSPLEDIPGLPTEGFDFVPVPEPKTVKNRIHWDVTLLDGAMLDDLVEVGAKILLPAGDDRSWTVMADPEGNEFCVFPTE